MTHLLKTASVLALVFQIISGAHAQSVDVVITNAKVITLDSQDRIAQAVAMAGDRIVAVGSIQEIQKLAGPETKTIDAAGRSLLPGLYDSHVHPLGASSSEADHPIPSFRSLADVTAYLRERTRVQPKGTWIVVRYAFPTRLEESRFPTRAELDAVAPDHMVLHQGGPAGVVNTLALTHSGITRDTPDPPAGTIVKDPKTGEPTGMMRNAYSVLKGLPDDAYRGTRRARSPRQGTVSPLQRARADQHRRPLGVNECVEALSHPARQGRTDRPGQRDPHPEPPFGDRDAIVKVIERARRLRDDRRAERPDRRGRPLGPDRPVEALPRRRDAQRHGLHA